MKAAWRPLVGVVGLPLWVRARDVALTVLIWVVLLWLMRHLRELLWTVVEVVADVPDQVERIALQPRWDIFLPFMAVAVLGVVVLALVTARRRAELQAQPQAFPEPALDPAIHAAAFGIDLQQLATLRRAGVGVVHFDEAGHIVRAEARGAQAQAAAPTGT